MLAPVLLVKLNCKKMNKLWLTKNFFNIVRISFLAIFFLADRYLKELALSKHSLIILKDWLSFNFVPNYYIAFSLPISGTLLILFICLIIIALFFYLIKNFKTLNYFEKFGFISILLGALSNLSDRLLYGFVIDYLDLRFFTVFNIADFLISLGSLIVVINLLKKDS